MKAILGDRTAFSNEKKKQYRIVSYKRLRQEKEKLKVNEKLTA